MEYPTLSKEPGKTTKAPFFNKTERKRLYQETTGSLISFYMIFALITLLDNPSWQTIKDVVCILVVATPLLLLVSYAVSNLILRFKKHFTAAALGTDDPRSVDISWW